MLARESVRAEVDRWRGRMPDRDRDLQMEVWEATDAGHALDEWDGDGMNWQDRQDQYALDDPGEHLTDEPIRCSRLNTSRMTSYTTE